ncbi:MAG TPA: hypothetical protein VNQ90_17690 [Chthoniobacteraceae bacterium]|nr:hypothetical protein [Chthoniobacteraceae bacterium]
MASVTTALIVGAVATAVAGGLSYYSAQEQAATSQSIAAYNAAVQRQQADLNAKIQIRQSEINQSMLQSQMNQTAALDNQAASTEAHAREEQRRLREEKLRLIGAQRAGFAAGGVLMEGTPLAVFSDTEYNFALQEMDIFKASSEQADSLRREAAIQRQDLGTQMEVEKLNAEAAKAGRDIGYNNAAMTLAQGAATARAYKLSGYGTLLSSASNIAGQYGDYKKFTATVPVNKKSGG